MWIVPGEILECLCCVMALSRKGQNEGWVRLQPYAAPINSRLRDTAISLLLWWKTKYTFHLFAMWLSAAMRNHPVVLNRRTHDFAAAWSKSYITCIDFHRQFSSFAFFFRKIMLCFSRWWIDHDFTVNPRNRCAFPFWYLAFLLHVFLVYPPFCRSKAPFLCAWEPSL